MSKRLITNLTNLLLIIVILPIAWVSYTELSKAAGLKPVTVEVEGTGSMYPSLFWDKSQGGPESTSTDGVEEYRSSPLMYRYNPGIDLLGHTYLKTPINYLDMVAFSSDQTRSILTKEGKDPNIGFIKRIIAKPGDTIELRDGYVIRNNQVLDEPYIRSARSTYAGTSLPECQKITIPTNYYFVLGDNRKISADSRSELGLVKASDIQFNLPYSKQSIYHPLWRSTTNDQSLSGTPTLAVSDFYSLLDNLAPNPKLENSARLRAEALLKNPDTSLDLSAALSQAGYHNIVTAEFVIYGHYTSSELYESIYGNYQTRSQFENSDYTEIGISAVTGLVNGCPTQVIVGHLGGYVPANYPEDVITSWQQAKISLGSVIPSWEQAVGLPGIDQDKLTELLRILYGRQKLIDQVLNTMNNHQWISDELQSQIDQDDNNATRANELSKQLNQQN